MHVNWGFLESKDTICYQICRDIKVKESRAASWWEIYKNKIIQTLNNKRADVTAAMKRTFMSKYKLMGEKVGYH